MTALHENFEELVAELAVLSVQAGRPVELATIHYVHCPPGQPLPNIPKLSHVIYIFSLATDPSTVLKVGRAGPRSRQRFLYHHYHAGSAMSTLAASLISRDVKLHSYIPDLTPETAGDWIHANCDRHYLWVKDGDVNRHIPNLFEAFLICRLQPAFERG